MSQKKYRDEAQQFVVEGEKSVNDLLSSDMEIVNIYHTKKYPVPVNTKAAAIEISDSEMSQISNLQTPCPVLAIARIPQYEPNLQSLVNGLVLMLDEVQDPGNVGTIIRMAEWFGIHTIICSTETADVYSPKVVQATMGSFSRMKIYSTQLVPVLEVLQAANTAIFGTFLEGDNIYSSALYHKGVIILGNEGHGISKDVAKFVTRKLYIPSYNAGETKVESLNVATAAAIVVSEFRRTNLFHV